MDIKKKRQKDLHWIHLAENRKKCPSLLNEGMWLGCRKVWGISLLIEELLASQRLCFLVIGCD